MKRIEIDYTKNTITDFRYDGTVEVHVIEKDFVNRKDIFLAGLLMSANDFDIIYKFDEGRIYVNEVRVRTLLQIEKEEYLMNVQFDKY